MLAGAGLDPRPYTSPAPTAAMLVVDDHDPIILLVNARVMFATSAGRRFTARPFGRQLTLPTHPDGIAALRVDRQRVGRTSVRAAWWEVLARSGSSPSPTVEMTPMGSIIWTTGSSNSAKWSPSSRVM